MAEDSYVGHLPTEDELWQDVPPAQRKLDAGYWIYRRAVMSGAWMKFVPMEDLLIDAREDMAVATGKAFSILTGERYFSLGAPGTRGRLNAFGWTWERDGKANVRMVKDTVIVPPVGAVANPGHTEE